jgi:hypothetical protein
MNLVWTKKCKSEEDKQQYVASLMRAKWVLDDLSELVDSNLAGNEAAEMSPKSYDNPNWPYRQAHSNGYKQALRDLKQLITISDN